MRETKITIRQTQQYNLYRQDLPVGAKISGWPFEEKQEICIGLKYHPKTVTSYNRKVLPLQ